MRILQNLDNRLKIANERKRLLLQKIDMRKNSPKSLLIHEQIELMRVNDIISLLNDLIEEICNNE